MPSLVDEMSMRITSVTVWRPHVYQLNSVVCKLQNALSTLSLTRLPCMYAHAPIVGRGVLKGDLGDVLDQE